LFFQLLLVILFLIFFAASVTHDDSSARMAPLRMWSAAPGRSSSCAGGV
jgi:hypothetical protein